MFENRTKHWWRYWVQKQRLVIKVQIKSLDLINSDSCFEWIAGKTALSAAFRVSN